MATASGGRALLVARDEKVGQALRRGARGGGRRWICPLKVLHRAGHMSGKIEGVMGV